MKLLGIIAVMFYALPSYADTNCSALCVTKEGKVVRPVLGKSGHNQYSTYVLEELNDDCQFNPPKGDFIVHKVSAGDGKGMLLPTFVAATPVNSCLDGYFSE